jgi:DNA-binding transcriptional LysR family regulator
MIEKSPLDNLKLGDISTFLLVYRLSSVAAAARASGVTASQVSKAIARLEKQLDVTLLAHASRRVQLTDDGRQLVPELELLTRKLQLMREKMKGAPTLTLCIPSSLQPLAVAALASEASVRWRVLELPERFITAMSGEDLYDVAITTHAQRLPPTWSAVCVGEIALCLLAPPALAKSLGETPISPEKLRTVTFVGPIELLRTRIVAGDDGCPLPLPQRTIGNQVDTMSMALEVAASTGQVVFGPSVVAEPYVRAGRLVRVPVRGWEVSQSLFLLCHGERIQAQTQKRIAAALRQALASIDE